MKPVRGVMMLLAGVCLLYPLSVGPVAKFYGKRNPPKPVLAFYGPLLWTVDKVRPLQPAFTFYLGLWGVR